MNDEHDGQDGASSAGLQAAQYEWLAGTAPPGTQPADRSIIPAPIITPPVAAETNPTASNDETVKPGAR